MSARPEDCIPGPSCAIATEALSAIRVDLDVICVDLRAVTVAVIGDEKLGHRGLVMRMQKTEEDIVGLKGAVAEARTSLKVVIAVCVVIASVLSTAASLIVQAYSK